MLFKQRILRDMMLRSDSVLKRLKHIKRSLCLGLQKLIHAGLSGRRTMGRTLQHLANIGTKS